MDAIAYYTPALIAAMIVFGIAAQLVRAIIIALRGGSFQDLDLGLDGQLDDEHDPRIDLDPGCSVEFHCAITRNLHIIQDD
jgi:hypothetical protein